MIYDTKHDLVDRFKN